MGGPRTEGAALSWIRRAVKLGRYLVSAHFEDQHEDRGLSLTDAKHAIEHAVGCSRYIHNPPKHGGTSWRLYGPGIDAPAIVVAFEAYRDTHGEWCMLITIVDQAEEQ